VRATSGPGTGTARRLIRPPPSLSGVAHDLDAVPVAPKIILSAPPHGKKPNEMTEAEIGEWADAIFDQFEKERPTVEAARA